MAGLGDDATARADSGTTRLDPGKYQVFATLGRGGMADVFLAVAVGLGGFNKLVVLKRLRPHLADEESFREMFLDEARLAARLNHPNVVQSYEVGEENGSYFIAMEYMDGQPLNRLLESLRKRGDRLDPAVALRIVIDVCSGLAYAHELRDYDGTPLGLIHRDVSPHNVFVTYDGQVKLCDFGIAKANITSNQTEEGVIKGKVAYMAPEQASAAPSDARADLFALGLVLWELLAGRRLFDGDNTAHNLHRLVSEPIPRPSTIFEAIDPELEAIVMRALEKRPADRYQSARELRAALEGALGGRSRDVRADDLGALVTAHFETERARIRGEIGKIMAAIGAGGDLGNEMRLATIDQLARGGESVRSHLIDLRAQATGAAQARGRRPASGAPAPRRRSRALAIGFAIGVLGVAALGAWHLRRAGRIDVAAAPATALPDAVAPGATAAGSAASVSDIEAARAHYNRGAELYQAGSLEPALIELERADQLAHTYKLLYDLALVQTDLGDFVSARSSLRAYLDEGKDDVPEPRRAEALRRIADLDRRAPTALENPAPSTRHPTSAASAASGANGASGDGRPPHAAATRSPTPTPNAPPSASAAVAADPPGYLTLDTYPWTRVSENGHILGTTPMVHVALSPGEHFLTLENADLGIHRTYRATIESGATLTRKLGVQ